MRDANFDRAERDYEWQLERRHTEPDPDEDICHYCECNPCQCDAIYDAAMDKERGV